MSCFIYLLKLICAVLFSYFWQSYCHYICWPYRPCEVVADSSPLPCCFIYLSGYIHVWFSSGNKYNPGFHISCSAKIHVVFTGQQWQLFDIYLSLCYIHVVFIPMSTCFSIFVDYIHVVFIPMGCFIYLLAISMLLSYQSVVSYICWLYPCCFHTNELFHIFVGYIHVVFIPMSCFIYLLTISMLFSYQWVVSYICWLYPCCYHTNQLFHIFVGYIHVVFIPITYFIYLLAISMLFSYQWVVSYNLLAISMLFSSTYSSLYAALITLF